MSTLVRRLPAAGLALAFVALAIIPLSLQGFQVGEWTFMLSFAIAAAGLNLMIADGGLVSLGHNAFFAFGAYTTAWFSLHGWTYWQCLAAVAVLALVLGWIVGPPMVKLGHLNFALITIGIGFVAPTIAVRLAGITGGANGEALPAFTAPQWTGLTPEAWLFFMGLLVLLACVLLIIGIRRSQAGRALRAQRDNRVAAEAFGVQVSRLRCGVFALSVMMAGLGGWLWSITSAFVAPDSFDSSLSIALLAGVVVGGLGLPVTAIFAGIFVEFLPSVSSRISPAFGGLVQGFIIVAVLLIARRGVLGTAKHWLTKLGERSPVDSAVPAAVAPAPARLPEKEPAP
jgi:branched-chain amino acid transport system permease protein